ncbi:Lrp/AsnC family transcriptional regulator [Nocardia sp. NPDC060256]|uniref:Lrp/AsnC family transcriptional regulator n=1 Tax=unclassified Nocardia TaxID=2637762 RepID=UPI00364D93CB
MPETRARAGVDELELTLLDALHANPRASFERLGSALNISAVTAARRWQRLSESGRAWVSSVPGPKLALAGAVYEVKAEPGRVMEVAQALATIPQVGSVYFTDGAFDIHTLVFTGDMQTLTALLLERLPHIPGIAGAQAHVGLRWHSGVQWRLGAIDTSQQRSVVDETENAGGQAARDRSFEPDDRALFLALQRDGRARYRDLARELGTSEHLTKRRLASLVKRGMMNFRTDFARSEGGWPAELVLWLTVPHPELRRVGDEIGQWPETRICLSTIGSANLMVMSQVHQIAELSEILDRIHRTFPMAAVADQRVVLRPCKSWGRMLDSAGHGTEVVPVDPWAPITEPSS